MDNKVNLILVLEKVGLAAPTSGCPFAHFQRSKIVFRGDFGGCAGLFWKFKKTQIAINVIVTSFSLVARTKQAMNVKNDSSIDSNWFKTLIDLLFLQ
jgi:hypothetical protein